MAPSLGEIAEGTLKRQYSLKDMEGKPVTIRKCRTFGGQVAFVKSVSPENNTHTIEIAHGQKDEGTFLTLENWADVYEMPEKQ